MPIMTRKEEKILNDLIRLAGGDVLLVERALKECSKKNAEPDLKDIVNYIIKTKTSSQESRVA